MGGTEKRKPEEGGDGNRFYSFSSFFFFSFFKFFYVAYIHRNGVHTNRAKLLSMIPTSTN
jgi:hypothetical protein